MKNVTRRKFLANTSLFSFVGLAGFAPFLQSNKKKNKNKKEKEMFVHHVYFWLKNPASEADRKKLLEGLNSLKPIETIKQIHVGKPANTDRDVIDTSYDFSLLLIFDNLEDQEVYQEHPIHLAFVDKYASLWSKVVVYDSVNA